MEGAAFIFCFGFIFGFMLNEHLNNQTIRRLQRRIEFQMRIIHRIEPPPLQPITADELKRVFEAGDSEEDKEVRVQAARAFLYRARRTARRSAPAHKAGVEPPIDTVPTQRGNPDD